MTTCDEAYQQTRDIRVANPGYPDHRYEADYVVTVAHWQGELVCRNLYDGPANGQWGPGSRRGAQLYLRDYGYTGPIDGDWGTNTWKAIQRLAADRGGYSGPIDGAAGPNTWLGIFCAFVPWN
ncbi:peptidoglycan-binding domain-containing protein [Rathayibacter agropyri]|uniref:peptidoglycan-binding domain-containing protein n=1 Tax=Rathayibacter agropyri TaxID=1634927 RepID=UPI003CCD6DAF